MRGGRAIKTDRNTSSNLNQLISRVKTIFGRKAHCEEKPTRPTTQQTKGILNLPNNVILLGYVKTVKGDDYLIEHLGNFIKYLMKLGVEHQIQHLAIAFSKEHYDTPYDVKNADITCIRLYKSHLPPRPDKKSPSCRGLTCVYQHISL